jgi:ureidoacrylate peracid hydrolase
MVRITPSVFRPALIVVDMQNGYCTKGGSYEKYGGTIGADLEAYRSTIPNIVKLLDVCHELKIPVFFTQQVREQSGIDLFTKLHRIVPERRAEYLKIPAVIRDTWDAAIIDELKPSSDDHIIIKRRDSAFQDTELDLWLRSSYIDTIICVGIDTVICVENTLEDGFNIGYDVILVEDATASSWKRIGEASVKKVAGSYGWVVRTAHLIKVLNEYECGAGSFRITPEYT